MIALKYWLASTRFSSLALGLSALAAVSTPTGAFAAAPAATRLPNEDVNNRAVRERAGLHPNTNLLFNGWGVTPAGRHVPVSDIALKLVLAPDKLRLIAVHGGFNQHGVTLLDPAKEQPTQFLPLRKSWNGLAFSPDGKRFFVSGGDSGELHIFRYTAGEAALDHSVKPAPEEKEVFLAGLAVHPDSGQVFVCDEANHEVWILNPDTLAVQTRVAVGQHPHSCALGADHRHLYVSDWGSRSVSVVDTRKARRVRQIAVGLRPTEMALAPDGRLFVACAGDNTVHVTPPCSASPLARFRGTQTNSKKTIDRKS